MVHLTEEGQRTETGDDEWEADRLLEVVSHDMINQQQAALGFLELLESSDGLTEGEKALVGRTMEVLERTGRLVLQVRTAMVDRERGQYRPVRVPLGKPLESASRSVKGAFAKNRLSIDIKGADPDVSVTADAMLVELLTQLLLLLTDRATIEKECSLRVDVVPRGDFVAMRFSSKGFPLNPMVIDALTGDRRPLGRSSQVGAAILVRHLLHRYGSRVSMEDAPAGEVGAHLVIELPSGDVHDVVDNDSG